MAVFNSDACAGVSPRELTADEVGAGSSDAVCPRAVKTRELKSIRVTINLRHTLPFFNMMGPSLSNRSKNVIAGQESPSRAQPTWVRRLTLGRFPVPVFFALLLSAVPASSQTAAETYRQTMLSIQQQIEADNFDSARTMISAAASKYPSDGGLDNLLGVVEVKQGHVDKARQDFSAAIKHDPHLASASMNLSRIDMQSAADDLSRRTEARRLSEKVLQLDPSNDEAKYQLATIFAWDHSYKPSLDYLETLSQQSREQVGSEALRCSDEAALG